MSAAPEQLGKFLVLAGIVLAGLGLLLMFGSRISLFGLGKLPGDISYRGRNVTFYFPVVTCLLLSVLASLLFWLLSYLSRK